MIVSVLCLSGCVEQTPPKQNQILSHQLNNHAIPMAKKGNAKAKAKPTVDSSVTVDTMEQFPVNANLPPRVFGIASNFSGRLSQEQTAALPAPLRKAHFLEAVRQISSEELMMKLQSDTIVFEEMQNGYRVLAFEHDRCMELSETASAMITVIERCIVIED